MEIRLNISAQILFNNCKKKLFQLKIVFWYLGLMGIRLKLLLQLRLNAKTVQKGLFSKKEESSNSIVNWINKRESTCFICTSVQNTFQAYMKTFFDMYKKHPEFREQVATTKGFCLDHFKVLCEGADEMLSDKERKDFYDTMLPLMRKNVERVYEDVAWFVEKYDYKNRDADWKNSKDAIQRGMQKLRGSDPSLPPHVLKK